MMKTKLAILTCTALFALNAQAEYNPIIGDAIVASITVENAKVADEQAKNHDKLSIPLNLQLEGLQFLGVDGPNYKFKTYKCRVNANWASVEGGAWLSLKNMVCFKAVGKGVTKYVINDGLVSEVFLSQDAKIENDKYELYFELQKTGATIISKRKNNGDRDN